MTDLTFDPGLSATTLQRHVVRLLEYGRPFDGVYDGQRWIGHEFDAGAQVGVGLMLDDRRNAVKISANARAERPAADLATEAVRELLTWASAA